MTKKDKKYLRKIMLERMTYHYAEAYGTSSAKKQIIKMEKRLNQTLSQLPEQQSGEIRSYLDYLFNRNARLEEMYYRSGFLDGMKLWKYIRK